MADEKTVTPDETKDESKPESWETKSRWVEMIESDDSISDKDTFAGIFLDMYRTAYDKCINGAFEKAAKDSDLRDIPDGKLSDETIAKLTRSKFLEYFRDEILEYTGLKLNLNPKSDSEEIQFSEEFSKAIFSNSKKEYSKYLKQKEQERINERLEANPDDPLDNLGDGYAVLNSHVENELITPVDRVTKEVFAGKPLPVEPLKSKIYPLTRRINEKGKIKWVKDESKPLDVTVRRDYGTLPIPLDATALNVYVAICSLFDGKDDDYIVVSTVTILDKMARHGGKSTEITAQELSEWIDILNHQRFSIDSIELEEILTAKGTPEENRKAYKKYFSSEKPLLEAYRKYAIVDGGDKTRKNSKTVVDAYEIRKPALLIYAESQNQISRSPMAELQARTPIKTGDKKVKSDLLKAGVELFISNSINDMKARHRSHRILFDTIYSESNITDSKEKAKIREHVFSYLTTLSHTGERVTGFKVILSSQQGDKGTYPYEKIAKKQITTKGKIFYAVDIELSSEWLKDTPKSENK